MISLKVNLQEAAYVNALILNVTQVKKSGKISSKSAKCFSRGGEIGGGRGLSGGGEIVGRRGLRRAKPGNCS